MTTRLERLKKLLAVQEQLKALHETRHAGFVANAEQAKADAREIAERFDAPDSLSVMFPEIYHRKISEAAAREAANRDLARSEATKVATATIRTNMVERSYREVSRQDEREKGDRERLDLIISRLGRGPGK